MLADLPDGLRGVAVRYRPGVPGASSTPTTVGDLRRRRLPGTVITMGRRGEGEPSRRARAYPGKGRGRLSSRGRSGVKLR